MIVFYNGVSMIEAERWGERSIGAGQSSLIFGDGSERWFVDRGDGGLEDEFGDTYYELSIEGLSLEDLADNTSEDFKRALVFFVTGEDLKELKKKAEAFDNISKKNSENAKRALKTMTPDERSARAKKAVEARIAKNRKK